MAWISDYVLDLALAALDTEANELHICSSEPADYTAATTTASLGDVALGAGDIGAPADRTGGGREVTVGALSGGNVTADGTATHFAIVDTINSRLLATGSLSASQAVTNGNTFSLASFTIGIPDPA